MGVLAKRKPLSTVRRCIIYCRVSSPDDDKQGDSIKEQERVGRVRAETLGYKPHEIVVYHEHFTGEMLWERKELADIRKEIAAGQASCLIVKKLDRLARDPVWQAVVIREVLGRGCEMDIILEPIDGSPEGELIRFVKGYAARLEIAAIKERAMSGKMAKRREGKRAMNREPYGFERDRVRCSLFVRDDEARWVIQVFEWAAAGKSMGFIAGELTRLCVPPPGVGLNYKKQAAPTHWGHSTVSRMIKNPLYKGVDFWGKTKSIGLTEQGRSAMRPVAREDWMEIKSNIPKLVDDDLWERAQAAVAVNRAEAADFTRNETHPVLLRGMVFCKRCGRRVIRTSTTAISCHSTGERKRYYHYRCSSNVKGKVSLRGAEPCRMKLAGGDWLEGLVWSKVVELLADPDGLRTALERAKSDGSRDVLDRDLATLTKDYDRERKAANALAGRLATAMAEDDDLLTETFEGKLAEIKVKTRLLAERIEECRAKLRTYERGDQSATAFEAMIGKAGEIIKGSRGPVPFKLKRLALELLGTKVVMDGQDVTASFSAVDVFAHPDDLSTQTPGSCIMLTFKLN